MPKTRMLLIIVAVALAMRANCATISEVKSGPLYTQAIISAVVTYLEPTECYLESTDRSSGIRVLGATDGLAIGLIVTANGTMDIIDGERCLRDATITLGSGSAVIDPLGVINSVILSAPNPSGLSVLDYKIISPIFSEWIPAVGMGNTGLLVKTWGTVKSVYHSPVNGARWFYIDDGKGVVSDFGDTGVLVYSDAIVKSGDVVSVTGISCVEPSADIIIPRLIRVVRTRTASDVQVERPAPQIVLPFSDEFDGPTLDPRWVFYKHPSTPASISLTQEPGWLAITTQQSVSNPGTGVFPWPRLMQYAPGAWQCDIKMRVLGNQPLGVSQWMYIKLIGSPNILKPSPGGYSYEWFYIGNAGGTWNGDQWKNEIIFGTAQSGIQTEGDTCYFRIRRTITYPPSVFVQASIDGVQYSNEVSLGTPPFNIFAFIPQINIPSGATATPFTTLIDYIRFTPIP